MPDPYCSKTQGGAGRERGDTHRTRTGAERHHTPAQTPTPARTAARTHPDRTRNNTVGTTQPRNNPGTRQTTGRTTSNPHLDPRAGALTGPTQPKRPGPMPPARPPPLPSIPACCSHIVGDRKGATVAPTRPAMRPACPMRPRRASLMRAWLIAAAKPTCRLISDTIQARASVMDREPNMRHWR